MKAVIFSGSQKEGKNSDSKAWCDLMKVKLGKKGIEAEVINLKDFDYEATTTGDILLPQIKKMYDAQLILFAGPVLHCIVSFPLYNLWHRFRHAHDKGLKSGVDIFGKKYFDFCLLFGSEKDYTEAPTTVYKTDFDRRHGIKHEQHAEKDHVPYPGRQHGIVYEKLNFIKNLGNDRLSVCLKSPMDPDGTTRDKMADDQKINDDIENLIIRAKKLCNEDGRPDCSEDEFVDFFRDVNGEFGRGMTVSNENLSETNVIASIKSVRENKHIETVTKAQIMLCMKERADRAGEHDLAMLYYAELFRLSDEEGFRINRCGIHRPSNY